MIQIRHSIFETNSSSTHAICISRKPVKVAHPSRLHFSIGEYGWELDRLSTPEEKASYLYTAMLDICEAHDTDELVNQVQCEIRNAVEPAGIICTFEEPEFEVTPYGSYLQVGYIDHASDCAKFVYAVMHDRDLLLRYLFSPDSFVGTGNDNSHDWGEIVGEASKCTHEIFEKWN